MGKKKEVYGSTYEVADVPVAKPKREISEAQRDNLKKGMAALKAKRNAGKAAQEEESTGRADVAAPVIAAAPVVAATPVEKPKRTYTKAPKKEVLGLDEFNNFKAELLGKLQPREVVKEVSVEKIVDRPVVTERVVEKEKFISSSELLNRIFFS